MAFITTIFTYLSIIGISAALGYEHDMYTFVITGAFCGLLAAVLDD